MKKNDWILILVLLFSACLLGGAFFLSRSGGHFVKVSVDGEEYGCYDLKEDQVIEIGENNRLEIKHGKASMIWAECPDQLCVHMVPICKSHELIVCLPNRVSVEVFEN